MKNFFQLTSQVEVNYQEVSNSLSLYEVKIDSPFISKKISGVGDTQAIEKFLKTPNNTTLDNIAKKGNWLLIKQEALEDLQKEAELNKYIDIKSNNFPGKQPQFEYDYKILNEECIKEINKQNLTKINDGFILIDINLEKKIIKNINENVIYFEQIYYLPIKEITDIGAEGITHYTYSSAPKIALEDMIKKGLKNKDMYTTEENFLNSFRKLLKKKENLQYVSEGSEISRLLNPKETSYRKAWELYQAFQETWNETNESIILTLLLFKIEGVDQRLGFNTSIFHEHNIRNKPDKLLMYQSIVSSVSLEHDLNQKKQNIQKTKI